MSDCTRFEIVSHSAEYTHQLGYRLGTLLQPGDVICLSGDLGVGKTALTRGIGAAWGVLEAVTSPTFTLVHEHHRSQDTQVLYHVDGYRLSSASEAWAIGLEEMIHDDGIIIIEWPENITEALPAERLWISLEIHREHTQRQIVVSASGDRYEHLCAQFRDHAV